MPDSAPLQAETQAPPRPRKRHIALIIVTILVIAVAALVLLWNWDWFIPFVDQRASSAIGRRVSIAHLHVRLGRTVTVTADDVSVANPDNFPQQAPLARADHVTVAASVMDYWHGRRIVLPFVAVDHPDIEATALADGRNNFTWTPPKATGAAQSGPPPQIGDLRITDGHAHVIDPKFRSNFTLVVATREAAAGTGGAIVADARGTYAGQPVTGHFVGGAVLALRDASHPYPIELTLANGVEIVRSRHERAISAHRHSDTANAAVFAHRQSRLCAPKIPFHRFHRPRRVVGPERRYLGRSGHRRQAGRDDEFVVPPGRSGRSGRDYRHAARQAFDAGRNAGAKGGAAARRGEEDSVA
jgi:hypothetical protein